MSIANGTMRGLVAGVWTRDGARQMRVARKLRCGQVFINADAGGGIRITFWRREIERLWARKRVRGVAWIHYA